MSKEVGEEERGRARMSGQEERQRHPSMLSCFINYMLAKSSKITPCLPPF